MHRISREQFEPQAREPFEITIESAQHRTVFDGDGSQVRVADEIAATPGADQQAGKQGRVTFRGPNDPRVRVRKPFIHDAQSRVQQ